MRLFTRSFKHRSTSLTAILLLLLSSLVSVASSIQHDPHSFSQPGLVVIDHLDLDLDVSFDDKILSGTACFRLKRIADTVDKLVLDTRGLTIIGAEAMLDGQWVKTDFSLGEADGDLGEPLTVSLPVGADQVRVHYASQPSASGLQWLTPSQTAGKQQPFLFSQSQAIHARSWVPLQDTPQVRFTYNANIRTPQGLKAVMSAENDPDDQDGDYQFAMPQRIPSYLMALAVGELRFQPMSERTGVYAEPSVLAAAAAEFDDTEAMMDVTEKRFGEYQWGRYDLLILPPSFPFGGMENPRLSFITPTVIAGDKSLVSLIAHELAHSWSGNLVTNSTWADLWLNEGFTTYLEGRIIEDIFGKDRYNMEAVLGYQDLQNELENSETPADTRLAIDLDGRDPDDGFSNVAYEKGRWFLTWLESQYGRERFDTWLKGYFQRHQFQSIDTVGFLQDISENLLKRYPDEVTIQQVRMWVEGEGMPEYHLVPQSSAFEPIDIARQQWLTGEQSADAIETDRWTTQQWLYFLNNLPEDIGVERMTALDQAFGLTQVGNNEIAHSWLKLAIHNDYQPAYARLEQYLMSIGRRKLIVPLYEMLMSSESGRTMAKTIYAQARPGYHPLAQSTIDEIVK